MFLGEAVAVEVGPGGTEGDAEEGAAALVDVAEPLDVVGGSGGGLVAGGGDVAGGGGDPGALGEGGGGAAAGRGVGAVGVVQDDLGEGGRAAGLVEVGADDVVADVGGAVGDGGLVDVAGGGEEDLGGVVGDGDAVGGGDVEGDGLAPEGVDEGGGGGLVGVVAAVVGDGAGELLAEGGAHDVRLAEVGAGHVDAAAGDGGLDDDAGAPGVRGLAGAVAEQVLAQLADGDDGGGVLVGGEDVPVAGVVDGDAVEGGRGGAEVGGPGGAVPAGCDQLVGGIDGDDDDVAVGLAGGGEGADADAEGVGEGEGAPGGAVVGAGGGVDLGGGGVVDDERPEGRAGLGEGDEVGLRCDGGGPDVPTAVAAADAGSGDAGAREVGAVEAGAGERPVGGDDGGVAALRLPSP